ncbi:MAG TPA: lysylphosphatidylglycerol synthase transmembrane domain-containing protein [Candidatus Nanoarchaeia archaeon]|nr:lysylphosphatidylglycerol synthase transmembrane domain-containing protein [Candidatus Nanoarchaeia archaeon]
MSWRGFLTYAALAALAIILVGHSGQIGQLVMLLHRARWYLLSLVVIAQAFSYYSNAKFYQSFLAIFNYQIAWRRLYKAALAINFVNVVFPSAGISGASFLSKALHEEVPTGKTTLTQVIRYVFTFMSFLAVLVLGFFMLFLTNNNDALATRVTLLLILVIIVGSLVLLVLIGERSRVEKFGEWVIKGLNWLGKTFARRRRKIITKDQLRHFFDEFYQGYTFLLEEKGHWWAPMWWALAGSLAEVATVYAVAVAFTGRLINPGIIIAGYTLANILSLVAVVAGGVGLYEATMIATFVTLGMPYALALSIVLVYRTLNFVLFLPFGFNYYRQQL